MRRKKIQKKRTRTEAARKRIGIKVLGYRFFDGTVMCTEPACKAERDAILGTDRGPYRPIYDVEHDVGSAKCDNCGKRV